MKDRGTGAQTHRRTEGAGAAAAAPSHAGAPRQRRPSPAYRALAVRLCVCASVTWGLAACGKPKPDVTAAVEAVADTADQVMFGLTQYITQNGVRKAYLQADTAFIYENAGKADLRKVRVTFFGDAGDTASVVTGKLGSYDWHSGRMEAREDVVVLLNNGGRLTTSLLRYDQMANQVSTDKPYTYVGPDQSASGPVGFTTDPSLSMFRTKHASGRAGSFRLPGQ